MINRLHRKGIVVGASALLALCAAGPAHAAYTSADFAADLGSPSTYTGGSLASPGVLTLAPAYFSSGLIDGSTPGLFTPIATNSLKIFTATSTMSAYASDPVNDLFQFGGTSGSQFDFNLTSLSEQSNSGILTLYGQGTVSDSLGGEQTSPASFTLSGLTDEGGGDAISGGFTLSTSAPVPEPATAGLIAAGGIALLGRRRRWRN